MPALSAQNLLRLYHRLYDVYGAQHGWPAESRFEVMVGAILVQNTAWKNVEKTLRNLKQAQCLSANRLAALPDTDLIRLLHPSGYFNIKAKRLKIFIRTYERMAYFAGLQSLATAQLRRVLLDVNGIGPETADDILLYAFNRPVFVVDAYTRRLFSQLDVIVGDAAYEALRFSFEPGLATTDTRLYNEYHALEKCTLEADCRHYRAAALSYEAQTMMNRAGVYRVAINFSLRGSVADWPRPALYRLCREPNR